jgi:putative transposase
MRRSRFSEEQILAILREAEGGSRAEVCRRHGISKNTRQRWRTKYAGMGLNEARRLRQLEDENRRLKKLVADLSLDKQLLQDALGRKW